MAKRTSLTPAVIVGMEANGLGVARALAQEAIPCIGLAGPAWSPFCQTNTCEIVYGTSWSRLGLLQDLSAIGKRLQAKAPLIITKDESVIWISEAREELAQWYEIVLPEVSVVNLLMNKAKFLERATKEFWPIPRTWTIGNKDELLGCMSEIVYPCILKPQVKNSLFREYSPKKAYKVNDTDELVRAYDLVGQWEKEVIIQEWIEGDDDHVAFCLTYSDRQGRLLGLFSGRKLRQWPIRCGNTALSEPAPIEWREPMEALTRKIWEKVGFRGIGSIEFKIRKGSNSPVIMEPTVGRTNFQNELAVINGVNLPAIAYFSGLQLQHPETGQHRIPVKLVDGYSELKSAWQYYRQGDLRVIQWLRERRGSKKYMVWRANDMGPFGASLFVKIKSVLSTGFGALFGARMKRKLGTLITGGR